MPLSVSSYRKDVLGQYHVYAVLLKGQPVAAAVVEFAGGPFAWVDRTFTAARGKGASCNGQPISVSQNSNITHSLLVQLHCSLPPKQLPELLKRARTVSQDFFGHSNDLRKR